MKLFWLLPVFILILFVKISLQQFDDAMREQDARALWRSSQESDNENTEATILLAIEKLNYSQLFDKTAIVNPALLALLYEILDENQTDAGKSQEYNRQAKLYYLKALQIKPSKSRYWASLAMIKWNLQEVDEDYMRYIMNAHRYGKHEPQTHIRLVQLGAEIISSDSFMSSNLKDIFLHHLIFGIKHIKSSGSILFGIIEDGSIRNGFCSWIVENESARKKLQCA